MRSAQRWNNYLNFSAKGYQISPLGLDKLLSESVSKSDEIDGQRRPSRAGLHIL
jgi:hypothetical protein